MKWMSILTFVKTGHETAFWKQIKKPPLMSHANRGRIYYKRIKKRKSHLTDTRDSTSASCGLVWIEYPHVNSFLFVTGNKWIKEQFPNMRQNYNKGYFWSITHVVKILFRWVCQGYELFTFETLRSNWDITIKIQPAILPIWSTTRRSKIVSRASGMGIEHLLCATIPNIAFVIYMYTC